MKLPGTTTEGVHTYSTADRPFEDESLYANLDVTQLVLTDEQQVRFEHAASELEQPYTSELYSGNRRREVEYHLLNDDSETKRDYVLMLGWGQSVADGATRELLQYLATLHPATRWIIPTTPGLDGTDRLPPEILADLGKGKFDHAGAYLLEAIRGEIRPDVPCDIGGYSQGASFATGIVAASGQDEFRNIQVFDPAALQHRTIFGMLVASQISSHHAKREAVERSRVNRLDRPTKRRLSRVEIGRAFDGYFRLPKALGKAGLLLDAYEAVPKLSGKMMAIVAQRSEYNTKPPKIKAALAHVAIGLRLFDGDHSTIVRHPSILAQLA